VNQSDEAIDARTLLLLAEKKNDSYRMFSLEKVMTAELILFSI